MSDTSLLFNFLKGRDTVSPHTRKVAGSFSQMASSIRLSSVISVAATGLMIGGMGGLISHAIALTAALGPLVGILAILPSVIIGAAAAFGALKMATFGLGDAMKRTGGGAGGAGAAVAGAEKRIAAAQREATAAQKAINDARRIAKEGLEDLARELGRAKLDEEGAILAVAEAERALQQARRTGDNMEIARADLGYRESVQTLEEVRDRLGDVTEEEGKRRKAGVEGSEEVIQATERHREALERLKEAQASLSAGGGGGGIDKAAEAYAKLSRAGKRLVDVLLALKPRWESIKRVVQQATFKGVAGDIERLAGVWFPMLRNRLGQMGAAWNVGFRGIARLASSKAFVADISTALGNMATFGARLNRSFAPFLSGFRHFALVGSKFMPDIGSWILRIGKRFEAWAAAARKTGQMQGWISKAIVVLRDVWAIAKNIGGAVMAIFRAGNPAGYLATWVSGTAALREWLESAEGQRKMAGAMTTLRNIASTLVDVLAKVSVVLLGVLSEGTSVTDTMDVLSVVMGFLADNIDLLAAVLPYLVVALIAYKAAQGASHVAALANIPIQITQMVVTSRHTAALKAQTAAMKAQAGTSMMAKGATVGFSAAQAGASAATKGASVATRGLGMAMRAIPIIFIVMMLIDLIGWLVDLYKTNETFRKIVQAAWGFIGSWLKRIALWVWHNLIQKWIQGFKMVAAALGKAKDFIVERLRALGEGLARLRDKVLKIGLSMWDGMKNGLKAAVNFMIRMFNALDFKIDVKIPDIPGLPFGGTHIKIDDVIPDLPYLNKGGITTREGLVYVHPREAIIPLDQAGRMGGGGAVALEFRGAEDEFVKFFKKIVRVRGGGNVQTAFGP